MAGGEGINRMTRSVMANFNKKPSLQASLRERFFVKIDHAALPHVIYPLPTCISLYYYHSRPNRALAARLRVKNYGLKWVLPIAEGDLYWQNP